MLKQYPHLLSPFQVGKTIFRNRLFSAPQGLHALQGGEPYPTEAIMTTFANRARGGAAMVTLHCGVSGPQGSPGGVIAYDLYSANAQHYIAQLADMVHFYGAVASMELMGDEAKPGYDVAAGLVGWDGKVSKEITENIMDEIAESYARRAAILQYLGYEMVMLHMGYGMSLGARFLSPLTNKRTDQYGGSVANRARFPIMIFDRIKQKCGKDFLIELRMSGAESAPGGIRIEDSIELAKLLEGHIDLLQVHAGDIPATHPLSFLPPTPNLTFAEAIKKSGTTLAVVTIGGFQDPAESEAVIASGVRRVVAAMVDPNPLVAGKGIEKLRTAGITVETGLMQAEAQKLNEAFARYIRHRQPLVTIKSGMTLDGKIAPPDSGKIMHAGAESSVSSWITSAEARSHVQMLRHESDSIMVGVGTVISDDPLLTDRTGLPRRRPLLRVVLDSRLRLPLDCRLVKTVQSGDVLVFCSFAEEKKKRALEERGIRVEQVPLGLGDGRPDLVAVVNWLGQMEITSLLIEGGALVNWTALASGIVDKVFLYYAPKILAGMGSVPFAGGLGFKKMADAAQIRNISIHHFTEDFAVEGYLRNPYDLNEAAAPASGDGH